MPAGVILDRVNSDLLNWRCRLVVIRAVVIFCAWLVCAEANSAPPSLAHLFPAGGQRGTEVVTTCTGEFSWPVQVWAPGVEVIPGDEAGKLRISIPVDLAADRVWIRLYSEEGASAAVPFLIGGLKESIENEPNDSPREAQVITDADVTINGILQKRGDVDGFAVELEAGQTLVAAVDANSRLGSPMDAILQVASPDGTVLAENHDDVGLDPRLAYTVTKTGTCIVRLFAFPAQPDTTIAFRGADNYVYRLTLTTGPFITHSVPLSVPHGEPGTVEVRGWNIPPGMKLPVVPLGKLRLADHPEFEALGDSRNWPDSRLGFAFAPALAGAARVRLVPHAVTFDVVSSDAGSPMTLTPPIAVTGCLCSRGQTDVFHLPQKKGQQAVISVESQSLDLPLVPVVRLTDPGHKVAAEVAETGPARDALITHTAAEDGNYRLTIRDRYGHGGDRYFYRLTVRFEESDFELSASSDAIIVTTDMPAELPITVRRRVGPQGAVGAINIEAIELPAGVTAPTVVSEPSGRSAEKVTLTFSTTGTAFSGPMRIRGTAEQPREIQRFARTPPRFATSVETVWLTGRCEQQGSPTN
jgi:hypothetical protein